MKRTIFVPALLAATAFSLTAPAMAADNGIYLGGSVGRGNVQLDSASDFDADGNGFKAIVGIRPLDFLGFEVNYVDLGEPDDSIGGVNFSTDATGIDAFAVGFLGLPFMDLFAKAGYISWKADFRDNGVQLLDGDGEDFAWGVGAQVRFGSAAIRAEYEKFDIDDLDDVNMISLGVTWTFL